MSAIMPVVVTTRMGLFVKSSGIPGPRPAQPDANGRNNNVAIAKNFMQEPPEPLAELTATPIFNKGEEQGRFSVTLLQELGKTKRRTRRRPVWRPTGDDDECGN